MLGYLVGHPATKPKEESTKTEECWCALTCLGQLEVVPCRFQKLCSIVILCTHTPEETVALELLIRFSDHLPGFVLIVAHGVDRPSQQLASQSARSG